MIRLNHQLLEYIDELYSKDTNNITLLTAEEGTVILEQRKSIYSVFILKEGISKCYLTEDTGNDFVQEFFGSGEIFGEIEMLVEDISFCTIEAITKVMYYKIPKEIFYKLTLQDNTFNLLILKSLANKIKYTALRHSYNQTHSIEEKILRLQNQFPDLFTKISKRDIANYLGITTRSLNRCITQMTPK